MDGLLHWKRLQPGLYVLDLPDGTGRMITRYKRGGTYSLVHRVIIDPPYEIQKSELDFDKDGRIIAYGDMDDILRCRGYVGSSSDLPCRVRNVLNMAMDTLEFHGEPEVQMLH